MRYGFIYKRHPTSDNALSDTEPKTIHKKRRSFQKIKWKIRVKENKQ